MPHPLSEAAAAVPHRNYLIDALRGIAILTVMGAHGAAPFEVGEWLLFFVPAHVTDRIAGNGYFGVDMFFPISGFLITTNILRRQGRLSRVKLKEFYLFRVARIAPPLLLFLVFEIVMFFTGSKDFAPANPLLFSRTIWSVLTFHYNVYYFQGGGDGLYSFAPLWTLSIEEMFYLFFPLACLLMRREGVIVLVLALLVLQGPWARSNFAQSYSWRGSADLLAIGCLTAILAANFPRVFDGRRWLKITLALTGIVLIFSCYSYESVRVTFRFAPTLVALGTAMILLAVSRSTGKKWSMLAPLAFMGRLSYELYLFHFALVLIGRRVLSDFGHRFVMLGVTTSVAWLIARFYSEPLNRHIRRAHRPGPPAVRADPAGV